MIIKPKYYGPSIPSTYAVNMTAAASGSNGITVADDDDIDFGTGDFFLHWEGSLPDWTPSASVRLWDKLQDANNYIRLFLLSTGILSVESVMASSTIMGAAVRATVATGLADGAIAKITACVVRETASAAGSVTYYLNGTQLGAVPAISAATTVSVSNSASAYICGTSSIRYASNTISCIVGNFAPTAAEVLDLCTNGIPDSWKWGSQTAIGATNGDFESWTTSTNPATWLEGSNVSASISQVTGGDQYAGTYSLQFSGAGLPSVTFNNTISQSAFWTSDKIGKKYRIQIAAKRTSGTGSLYVGQGQAEYSTINTASGLSSSWVLFTIEKTVTTVTGNASLLVIAGDPGSTFQVDAYTITPLGATMALLPNTIPTSAATTWDDSSGKTGGGTLPAAGATKVTIRK